MLEEKFTGWGARKRSKPPKSNAQAGVANGESSIQTPGLFDEHDAVKGQNKQVQREFLSGPTLSKATCSVRASLLLLHLEEATREMGIWPTRL